MSQDFGFSGLSLGSGEDTPRSTGIQAHICQNCGKAVANVNDYGICAPCVRKIRDAPRKALAQAQTDIDRQNRAEEYANRNRTISTVNLTLALDKRDQLAQDSARVNQIAQATFTRACSAPQAYTVARPPLQYVLPGSRGQVYGLAAPAPALALAGVQHPPVLALAGFQRPPVFALAGVQPQLLLDAPGPVQPVRAPAMAAAVPVDPGYVQAHVLHARHVLAMVRAANPRVYP